MQFQLIFSLSGHVYPICQIFYLKRQLQNSIFREKLMILVPVRFLAKKIRSLTASLRLGTFALVPEKSLWTERFPFTMILVVMLTNCTKE